MHQKIWPPGYTPEPQGIECVSSDILVAVCGKGIGHSTHTLAVIRAISGSPEGKGKGGREMGKYIQNINARDLIFQIKLNRPDPLGELKSP